MNTYYFEAQKTWGNGKTTTQLEIVISELNHEAAETKAKTIADEALKYRHGKYDRLDLVKIEVGHVEYVEIKQ